ncbi:MAG: 1-acyl-sn-glycerol-3-phosphate acyltransferase, partial [Gemmataceae bacterium]|nr:1-acyl-sn-glycerol-3-phosphate acyltransferase [Gemmataceae bacterium]
SRLRQTYWAGWTGAVFGNPLSRLLSRLTQVVPIDPQRGVVSSLAFGAAVLKRGRCLVWYPEGRRSPTGALQPFKPGIGMLLERFPVPVVPVFLRGTHEALPPGKILPQRKQITVVFGPPLHGRDLEQQGEGAQPHDRIADALHDQVAELEELSRFAGASKS